MDRFTGNTNGVIVTSQVFVLPRVLKNFTLIPHTGTVGVSVYLIQGATQYPLMLPNKQISDIYTDDLPRLILATEQIKIQPAGLITYHFTMDNVEAPSDDIA